MWLRFDDRERRTLRIDSDRAAPDAGAIFRGLHDARAKLGCFLHFGVTVLDGEIDEPVWWNRSHFGRDLVHATYASVTVVEDGVFHGTSGKSLSGPAKYV